VAFRCPWRLSRDVRAQGKRLGRPTISAATNAAIRKALKKGGIGIRKIATTLGVGTGTVQQIKAECRSGSTGRLRRSLEGKADRHALPFRGTSTPLRGSDPPWSHGRASFPPAAGEPSNRPASDQLATLKVSCRSP
jgi:hypothetical protein